MLYGAARLRLGEEFQLIVCMDVRLILLILLLTFSALADEPTATPSPTPGDVDSSVTATPESTYRWQKIGVHSDLQEEWNKLSEGITKLQHAVDELTEEVSMFSQQLVEEINEEAKRNEPQVEPTPSPTPE